MQIETAVPIAIAPAVMTPASMSSLQTAKLADSAQKFEAMLLDQMLKPLQFGGAPGDDDTTGGAADTIRGMGSEALSSAIAKGGGFGIAKQIVRKVTAEHEEAAAKQHMPKV